MKNSKTTEKISKTKNWLFENSNKVEHLGRKVFFNDWGEKKLKLLELEIKNGTHYYSYRNKDCKGIITVTCQ